MTRSGPRRARWWQPELWLVLGIPIAALAGGAATLRAVEGDLSSDGVVEGVRRTAQMQEVDLTSDLAAARRRLGARVRIDRANGLVDVDMPSGTAGIAPATLVFVHRLRASNDVSLSLRALGTAHWSAHWPAGSTLPADAPWRLVLEGTAPGPAAAAPVRWRLVGTLPRGESVGFLQPAVTPP